MTVDEATQHQESNLAEADLQEEFEQAAEQEETPENVGRRIDEILTDVDEELQMDSDIPMASSTEQTFITNADSDITIEDMEAEARALFGDAEIDGDTESPS